MCPGMGNRCTAIIRSPEHLQACLQIFWLAQGGFEISEQFLHPSQRIVVADRVGDIGGKALNQMAEGVNTG